jgi:hypothetical protein
MQWPYFPNSRQFLPMAVAITQSIVNSIVALMLIAAETRAKV